jgi:hypothetical protein
VANFVDGATIFLDGEGALINDTAPYTKDISGLDIGYIGGTISTSVMTFQYVAIYSDDNNNGFPVLINSGKVGVLPPRPYIRIGYPTFDWELHTIPLDFTPFPPISTLVISPIGNGRTNYVLLNKIWLHYFIFPVP